MAPYHIAYLHSWPLMGTSDPRLPPSPIPPLDFDGERNLLFAALTKCNRALRVFTSHATTGQLLRLLMVGCRVLHYSGHGMATGLAFESDAGDMQKVDAATLHQMMSAGAGQSGSDGVQVAFVSACHSEGTALAFIQAGVRHVIAVRSDQQIHDQAAQKFLSMFYLGLTVGKTVREAFDYAKVSVLASPVNGAVEDKKFLLLPLDGDHDVAIFGGSDISAGLWVDCSEEETPNNLQGLPDSFIARNAEMQEVVSKLVKKKRKLVTLTGGVGVGKTALAIAAATYICKRHLFHGVFHIDLSQLLTRPSATLATLCSEAMSLATIINNNAAFVAFMRAERRNDSLLFLFDEAELSFAYDAASQRCLSSFLAQLLSASTQSRALLTSLDPLGALGNQQESLLPVHPLSPNDSLKLFFNLKPREIEYSEFGCMTGDSRDAARILSRHPVLVALEGVPRRIWRVEEMLGAGGMRMHEPRLMEAIQRMVEEEKEETAKRRRRYRSHFGARNPATADDRALLAAIQRVNPNQQPSPPPPSSQSSPPAMPAARFPSQMAAALWAETAGTASHVAYPALERALQSHFVRFCETPTRGLSADDLAVIRRKVEHLAAVQGGGGGGKGQVTVDVFIRLWPWFHALEWTVRRCQREWMWRRAGEGKGVSPVFALHGFMEREQSDSWLRSMHAASHPFLVRLSENRSGCLTVCWLLRGEVTYTLIRVEERDTGGTVFSIDLDDVGPQAFASLAELMMTYPSFMTMFPSTPKEDAFGAGQYAPHQLQQHEGQQGQDEREHEEHAQDEGDAQEEKTP